MFSFVRVRSQLLALGVILLAFLLRVYRLGDRNIWWDEAWTVWLARHDLAWIALRTASDEHPPLHYWLMHFWQSLFSPDALLADALVGRFFSVVFAVLTVALIYRVGKQIGGAPLGLLAALFFALARFQVWWSQDIKNYTLSGFFALASVWFAFKLINSDLDFGRKSKSELINWFGYGVSITTALYSHYLAALIFLANNLFVAVVLLQRWRAGQNPIPLLLKWSAAQVAVLALFAPWLYFYLQNSATWTAQPAFDFGLFLRVAATVLGLGVTTYIENYTLVVAGLVVLAALGAGWIVIRHTSYVIRHSSRFGALYALLIVLVPPVLIYALSLTPAAIFAPKIQPRYLLIVLPGFSLLLALGVLFLARVNRLVAVAALLFVIGAQGLALTDYYRERILQDDYFSLAQMINSFAKRDDAIVLNTDQEWTTFLYYLKPPLEWVGVPNGAEVNEATAQRIAADALQHRAVWLVAIPDALVEDPQRLVEQKIAERLPKQYEQTFGDKRLVLYSDAIRNVKDVAQENFSPQFARNDVLDDRLQLVGLDLPVRDAQVGDAVRVVTYWAATDLATINLALETRDGRSVARQSIPISIGARERAQGDLVVPPEVRAEELRVTAQARLHELALGTVRVIPRGVETTGAGPMDAANYRFGESIRLVGMSVPTRRVRAGENVQVTLYWQADAPVTTSYTVFVHLLGAQYNPVQNNFLWGQVDRLPLDGKLPTTAWTAGQVIADAYQVKLNDDAPPGVYKIEIGLYDAATGARLRVSDAKVKDVGDAAIVGEAEVK